MTCAAPPIHPAQNQVPVLASKFMCEGPGGDPSLLGMNRAAHTATPSITLGEQEPECAQLDPGVNPRCRAGGADGGAVPTCPSVCLAPVARRGQGQRWDPVLFPTPAAQGWVPAPPLPTARPCPSPKLSHLSFLIREMGEQWSLSLARWTVTEARS